MRFQFVTSVAGAVGCFVSGTVIDVLDPAEEPIPTWLRSGIVIPVRGDGEVETAIVAEPERAVRLRGRGRQRATAVAR